MNAKETIAAVDALLSQVTASGNNLLLLAAARGALQRLHEELKKEDANGTSEHGK